MQKKIKIFDTTLRDGEQSPGCTLHIDEKIEIALKLEQLNIDIIEAGFPVTSDGEFKAVQVIAEKIKNSEICALARTIPADIDRAIDSIARAQCPRVHIFIATSPIHMTNKLMLTEAEVLERIDSSIRHAKKRIGNVQFSFEDSTRSDIKFLIQAVNTAKNAGATTINFADTVGYACPEDIAEMFDIINNEVDLNGIELGIHCHNDLGMAVANSLTAIKHGVNHIEGTINGIGERGGNASLEEIIMALVAKPGYNAITAINTKEIYSTSRLLSNITGVPIPINKPIVGGNAFLHESGIHQHGVLLNRETYEIITPESIGVPKQHIVLGKHSGKHALEEFLRNLGISYTTTQLEKYFADFKTLCDKKKLVTALDVEALIAGNRSGKTEQIFTLKNFLIATKKDGAFATVTLNKGTDEIAFQADGNGAIDSSFTAVNRIIGVEFTLLDYSLHAITGGEDALGEAVVKLRFGETTTTGRGISTDIIEASILSYLDAANKLLKL